MELNYLKIIESVLILVGFVIARALSSKVIDRTLSERFLQESRGVLLKRAIYTVLLSLSLIGILIIWGVKQSDIGVFIGSILTVVGVAFFAQWSILSNITSSLILFFNHPVRLNDFIAIMEGKDYTIEGKVLNIGLFFVTIETKDEGELTLPNNIFIQKSIKKLKKPTTVVEEEKVEKES